MAAAYANDLETGLLEGFNDLLGFNYQVLYTWNLKVKLLYQQPTGQFYVLGLSAVPSDFAD